MKRYSFVGTAMATLAMAGVAYARVGTIDVVRLARYSDAIVVGTVSSIREVEGVRVASIDRVQNIKGLKLGRIAFVAERTWKCDTSTATRGERVLLYLQAIPHAKGRAAGLDLQSAKNACSRMGTNLYLLAHSGRGRIPLLQRGKDWFARVRLADDYPPELNINLTLPRNAPITKERGNFGVVALSYFTSLR